MWVSTPYYFQGGCCKECGEVTHLARHCPNKGKQDLISSRDDGKQTKNLLNVYLQYQNCFYTLSRFGSWTSTCNVLVVDLYIQPAYCYCPVSAVSRQVFHSIVMVCTNMDHILCLVYLKMKTIYHTRGMMIQERNIVNLFLRGIYFFCFY